MITLMIGWKRMEKRSDDVTETKYVKLWDWFAYPERTR